MLILRSIGTIDPYLTAGRKNCVPPASSAAVELIVALMMLPKSVCRCSCNARVICPATSGVHYCRTGFVEELIIECVQFRE